ncbi:MAG TPA: hypothetical protein VMK12_33070 [Anaeromyxobacteraceae bacterium]|nr:hypothetical protein [Anaeromyxobacteraceae bacterium]
MSSAVFARACAAHGFALSGAWACASSPFQARELSLQRCHFSLDLHVRHVDASPAKDKPTECLDARIDGSDPLFPNLGNHTDGSRTQAVAHLGQEVLVYAELGEVEKNAPKSPHACGVGQPDRATKQPE